MTLPKYSQSKFFFVLGIGGLVALVLCVQCVRTYLYADAVLVPQQAAREAERQAGAVSTAARSAGIADPRALGPVLEHALESAPDRLLWMRVLNLDGKVVAQSGRPLGAPQLPARWWERVKAHDDPAVIVDTPQKKALVATLPFRMPGPPRFYPADLAKHEFNHAPGPHRPAYVIEIAISLESVGGAFEGLRQSLIVGVIAAVILLVSLVVIALRTPQYIRGRYLETQLQLARLVQSDLQPKPQLVSPCLEFAAAAIAADHVGGDFYDIFETETGKIAIVLGDVSGKGVPAALLVSVLQGAIRSSTAWQHEFACEQINRMLCERTACERFATLFWGVFDPATNTLRYVNAGHAAPSLIRRPQHHVERLGIGGPVLGLLSKARYSAGTVKIDPADMLILYSDGISEATNRRDEEFGEDRIHRLLSHLPDASPHEVCNRLMEQVGEFASLGVPADDRTLLVVKFQPNEIRVANIASTEVAIEAFA